MNEAVATVYQVNIAGVPDADLSANARSHWAVKARKVKALREFAGWQARENAPPEPISGPVMVRVSIGWPKGRKRQDPTNVEHCLKAVIDGLTDAGFWADDRLVTIARPIVQRTWGEWGDAAGWQYPGGVISLEIEVNQ